MRKRDTHVALREQGVRVHRIEECLQARAMHSKDCGRFPSHGSVSGVDERCIASLFAEHCLPLCLPIIGDLNCNATMWPRDRAVTAAEKLIFLTGTKGILVPDPDGADELLTSATPALLEQHIQAGHIEEE